MAEFSVVFARSARKELEALGSSTAARVLDAIARLRTEPRPPGVKKLRGTDHLWRLRVGVYRVIYALDEPSQVVDIRVVRHRKDAYR